MYDQTKPSTHETTQDNQNTPNAQNTQSEKPSSQTQPDISKSNKTIDIPAGYATEHIAVPFLKEGIISDDKAFLETVSKLG